jgi:hypothetical protein
MRTSKPRTRSRLLHAAIAVATMAAVAVATTATPAFAANIPVSVTPGGGPTGGTITVVDPGASAWLTATAATTFTTSACGPTYVAASASVIAATTVASTDNKTATVGVPTGLTLTADNAHTYFVCVYATGTVGSALIGNSTYTLVPVAAVTPISGPSGGGNTLTVNVPATGPVFASAPTTTIALGGCPTLYSGAANIPVTATKVSTSQVTILVPLAVGGPKTAGFSVCFYTGTGSGTLVGASFATYNVTLPVVTMSSNIGPAGTLLNPVSLTVSSVANFLTGVTTPMVVLVAAPALCTGLYPASATIAATGRKVANNKAAFTLPVLAVVVGSVPTPYNVCLYSSSSISAGRLLSSSTYTVALGPAINSVFPSSGPALGGSLITVSGQNFPTTLGAITATLGGTALTAITPVDATTFTAMTPPHSTGTTTLVVNTATGSDTAAAMYTFVNSVVISPNTAPNTSVGQDIDVAGTGFLDYAFVAGAVSTTTDSHAYLVSGTYNDLSGTGTVKANGPVAECGNVLVISDTELICTLGLTAALNPLGVATPSGYRSISDGVTTGTSSILTSASANFTQADVGKALGQTLNSEIAVAATIVAVIDKTRAVMSDDSVQAGTALTVTIGYTRAAVAATASTGDTAIVGAAATFTQADVGRYVTGGGLAANTYITAVNNTGTTATISIPATAALLTGVATISSANQVPNGAYNVTVVNNGAMNASSTFATYNQTVVSSSSAFTVAPF